MNLSGIIGIVASLSVFFVAILTTETNSTIFMDKHAILIVLGGTLAATLLCFPPSSLYQMVKVFFGKILASRTDPHEEVIKEIVALAEGLSEDPGHLNANWEKIKNLFLRDAIELMTQGGVSPQDLDLIIQMRADTHYKRYEQDALMFKTISKFPPAFGLMGTTLGMIALLQGMGSPDAIKSIGPSMAIGLVATFYGIALANLIFIPLSENLMKMNKKEDALREIVIEGVRLLRKKSHPLVVEEYLKSFLLPSERQRMKKAG